MTHPWGHKITLSVYIEHDDSAPIEALAILAGKGVERELRETYEPTIDFIGASVEEVREKPKDRGTRND